MLSWCAGCLWRACAAVIAATTAGIVARAELLRWGLRGSLCLLLAGVGSDVLSREHGRSREVLRGLGGVDFV